MDFWSYNKYSPCGITPPEMAAFRQVYYFYPEKALPLKLALDFDILGRECIFSLLLREWVDLSEDKVLTVSSDFPEELIKYDTRFRPTWDDIADAEEDAWKILKDAMETASKEEICFAANFLCNIYSYAAEMPTHEIAETSSPESLGRKHMVQRAIYSCLLAGRDEEAERFDSILKTLS